MGTFKIDICAGKDRDQLCEDYRRTSRAACRLQNECVALGSQCDEARRERDEALAQLALYVEAVESGEMSAVMTIAHVHGAPYCGPVVKKENVPDRARAMLDVVNGIKKSFGHSHQRIGAEWQACLFFSSNENLDQFVEAVSRLNAMQGDG